MVIISAGTQVTNIAFEAFPCHNFEVTESVASNDLEVTTTETAYNVTTGAFDTMTVTTTVPNYVDVTSTRSFMQADPSVDCDSESYRQVTALAVVAVLLYPVGGLIFIIVIVCQARPDILAQEQAKREGKHSEYTRFATATQNLWGNYAPHRCWWEVCATESEVHREPPSATECHRVPLITAGYHRVPLSATDYH